MTLLAALAQFNPTVGDLSANSLKIRQAVAEGAAGGAQLVLCGEMCLTGYPVEDLALRNDFQVASREAVEQLAADLAADGYGYITTIVGYLDFSDSPLTDTSGYPRGGPTNSAAVIRGGMVTGKYNKHFLPNYGVFDEARYFLPGNEPLIIDIDGARVAIAICEDLWREGGPVQWAREGHADVLAVLNASPFERDKDDVRLDLCQTRAPQAGTTILYTNIVGGQDELVFDGGSMAVSASGSLMARAPQFEECVLFVELDAAGTISPELDSVAEVWEALVLSLRDYVNKNGFQSVLLGASGGIDSAVVAAIAVDALGPERVHAVALPSPYSSEHSVSDAVDLAARTGLALREIPIAPMFSAYLDQLREGSVPLPGLTEENLQARIRGTTLMALSNAEGHLVLATGNKSELSVGYSTIYGDAVGGFAPIKDVPKTLVWELARWRNEHAELQGNIPPIPPNSITKEPSAELRPDQKDTDSLPDYELLDAILDAYVHQDQSAAELIAHGFDPDLVHRIIRLTDLAEYKRRQYPPGTKITLKAFGRDRRLPITNKWRS